ncbi:hypothetical protein F5Y10DRAFT_286199 [Nemania abortiva]|nr:hypothetical protein F5Y10DRAFT_286199 [Nemania abortiva]
MDPVSAIGFGAALVQLTANIVQCCKILNDVRRAFEHAPQDIERLYKALRRLQWLIDSIRELGDGIEDCLKPAQLGILWKEHAVEIETDVKDLAAKIKKIFMQDELERYERSICRHQEVFSLILGMLSESALTHCCRLMHWACSSSETLMPILNLLVQNGADITSQDEEGLSAISYMLDARQGHHVSYARADSGDLHALLNMLDLDVFEDMNSLDFWLVATYASSTMPSIRLKLESQLKERRTPIEISSSTRPIQETLPELYIDEQLKWIKTATVSERVRFIRLFCAHGDEDTIRPFLECGIDVNETESGHDLATYMRAAAEQGKVGTMKTLLESGASVDCEDAFLGFDEMCTSAVDDLVIRWHRRMSGESPWVSAPTPVDDEYWMMPLLFELNGPRGTGALLGALLTMASIGSSSRVSP